MNREDRISKTRVRARPLRAAACWLILVAMPAAARIEVHGHRGARSVLPENTLPGFEYAIRTGADYLELDLQVTRDGVLVVSHDPVLREDLCRGPDGATRVVHHMTLAELKRWDCGSLQAPGFPRQKPVPGARVPTLDEVLELADRGAFGFNIEMKVPREAGLAPPIEEFARLVVEAVRRHGLKKRVIIQSFHFPALREVKRLAPELRTAALWSGKERDFVEIAREAGAKIVSPHYRLVTKEQVKRAHAAGIEVVPWTANDPEIWERLVAAGVDGIITDDPAGLIAWLEKRGLR